MGYSGLTDQVRQSSQSSPRNGVTVDTFLIHHQAGVNDDATIAAMISGSRQVSANYTISTSGRLTSVVDESRRAWTSGSTTDGGKGAAWDRRSITVEIANSAIGGNWPISEAALSKAAALLKDLRTRYSIANVLGHRDLQTYGASYPTYCPGPQTVALILAREGGAPVAPAAGAVAMPAEPLRWIQGDGARYMEPTGALAQRIGTALAARKPPRVPSNFNNDGDPGPLWRAGVQTTLNVAQLWTGKPDGRLGPRNLRAVQQYAQRYGGYTGPVDGDPRMASWSGFALGLERP